MPLPNNRRSVNVGNNVFENLYVYGDCEFDKDVTINGEFKYDNLSVKTLSVENSFSVGDDVKVSLGIVTATKFVGNEADLTGIVTATKFVGNGADLTGIVSIPTGVIVMWSGSVASIPSGWTLCDGSNGTPDLRNRFIAGAGTDTLSVWGFDATSGATTFTGGQSYVGVNSIGGSIAHKLIVSEMPSHTHSYQKANSPGGGQDQAGSGSGDAVNHSNQNTSAAGGNNYHENRPPYYALAFIMKT